MSMRFFFRSPVHWIKIFSSCFAFCIIQNGYASGGPFFDISTVGITDQISITLSLNGKSSFSQQIYTVDAMNLTIKTTIPNREYKTAGIKINTPGYTIAGLTPTKDGYYLFPVSNSSPANLLIIGPNSPWYPSLEAFEHYNSGRSHVFAKATFGGNYSGMNSVNTLESTTLYPSGYNMSYLNSNNAFIYGGGYGDVEGSIGAFVARINPDTLEPIWYNQLIDVRGTEEWDYPGSMGILQNGFIYVSYGYRLAKLDATGQVINTLVLPTGGAEPKNTSFNGFNATSDGFIIMKSVYREAGCLVQGPNALLNCPNPSNVPASILVSVDPDTMEVIDSITLSEPVGARPTITVFQGKNYVYLLEPTTAIRYEINQGKFILDTNWNPGTITLEGQTLCTSFSVMNDWVVAQTNTLPASTALDVIAINQGNALKQYKIQPFAGDPIPPLVQAAFQHAGPGGTPAVSWAPMSLSSDSDNNLIFASDSLPGKIAALTITSNGLEIVWKVNQTTTEFTTLIGTADKRILVGTDIPNPQIPGNNTNDFAVWRIAATGEEIARSPELPAMTQGTMIQPYYNGEMFFEGQLGTLIKLTPTPQ